MTDLDANVRATDPDRWASSRFVADTDRRADLIALYALDAELAAIPSKVSQPLLAEMRFSWWRDHLEALFDGRPRKGHPVLEALAAGIRPGGLQLEPLLAVVDAHIDRVHAEPHDLTALFVVPMQQAARLLGAAGDEPGVALAGQIWGLSRTGRRAEASALKHAANAELARLPTPVFPAVAHAALVDPDRPEPLRRLHLAWAVLRGRL